MSLGPYPAGDAAGMQSLAAELRRRASTVEALAPRVSKDLERSTFESQAMVNMTLQGGMIGLSLKTSAAALTAVASQVAARAETLAAEQAAWRAAKRRLDEQRRG